MYSKNVRGEQLSIYLDKVCNETSKNSYNHCTYQRYSSQCYFKYSLMHFWKNKLNTCASFWFYKPSLMSTSNDPFVQFRRIPSQFLRFLENYIEIIIICNISSEMTLLTFGLSWVSHYLNTTHHNEYIVCFAKS